jgi:predicted hydrolase (HD superfamily)
MIDHNKALKFLNDKGINGNIVKHMLATEALMAGVYDYLKSQNEPDLGGTKQEWQLAGLFHDGDYLDQVPVEQQGIKIAEWLRQAGFEIPNNVAWTMAAHNWDKTGVEPKTKMDWALFCGDSLTGLIVATALVRPDKKLSSVTVESVMKKFTTPAFAAGTRREDIKKCEEKLNIPLEKFVEITLKSMQGISDELGL